MKINISKIFNNLLPQIIMLLSIGFVAFTLYFIYENVLNVFSYTSAKENLIKVDFDIDLFKKIAAEIENKKSASTINIESLKNPFITVTPPTTPKTKK